MEDITNKILETFKKNWNQLSWEKQRHFAYRAKLVSKDLFWARKWPKIVERSKREVDHLASYSNNLRREYGLAKGLKAFSDKPNDLGKLGLYKRYPEIIFWEDYLVACRYSYWGNKRNFIRRIKILDVSGLKRIMRERGGWQEYPVWMVERTFDLNWFWDLDLRNNLELIYKQKYQAIKNLSDLWNAAYFLTHVVIGYSNYYQQKVDSSFWAVEELIKQWGNLKKMRSVDLLSEAGVCLKLANKFSKQKREEIKTLVKVNWQQKPGYLVRPGHSLTEAEHRNIMTVMALSNWR